MQYARQKDFEMNSREDTGTVDYMRDPQKQEFDFNLSECLQILIKRKKLFLIVFLTLVIIAIVWSFIAPMIFEVSMIIEPPVMNVTDSGVQNLDTVENIKAKIEEGAFNNKILRQLDIPEEKLKFIISQPRNTRLLKISLRKTVEKADSGVKILD